MRLQNINNMVVTFLRTIIIFVTLVVVMRLMGKRQIGEMQPFEFIVTLIIADLACIPMADVSTPLIYGLVSIISLFILHQIFSLLEQSGKFMKKVISGKPSLVITKDGVDVKELRRNNLSVDDLIESMRSLGYFSFDDVLYAIYESNGKLSAFEDQSKQTENPSMPILLIDGGKIDKKNTQLIKCSFDEVKDFLRENRISLKDVEIMTVDGNGRVYLKRKNKKYSILHFYHKGGIQW